MSQLRRILRLTFLALCLPGCAAPTIKQDALSTSQPSSPRPVLADPNRNEAIMAELRQLGAVDPESHQRLMENLGKSDPSIWPLVMEQFRATEAYRQRVRQREALAMQKMERLPPVAPRPFVEDIPTEPAPAGEVVQTSFPSPETSRQISESSPLVLCNLAFCTDIQGYGSCRRCERNTFKPGQEVLLYAEVEGFQSVPTSRGYGTTLKSEYRIVDGEGRCFVEKTYAPTEDYCRNLRCDFFIGYRIVMPSTLPPGAYRLILSVEDQASRQRAEANLPFSVEK